MLPRETLERVHRSHAPGASAQAKLEAALEVRANLRRGLQVRAQANLAAGASLLAQAAAQVGGEAGALLQAAAGIMAQARADLASGKPPEVALAGRVLASLPNPPAGQALPHLARAVATLALRGGQASAALELVTGMATLAVQASQKGLGFQLGVAWPLARGVALRGSVSLVPGRRLEARLGLAGRLQIKLGG